MEILLENGEDKKENTLEGTGERKWVSIDTLMGPHIGQGRSPIVSQMPIDIW